jgi:excinuclease UvrABC ATPase subunit
MAGFVHVQGAREHNLRDVDVHPRDALVVFTDISGSATGSSDHRHRAGRGRRGGRVVAFGSPREVAQWSESHTRPYFARFLE